MAALLLPPAKLASGSGSALCVALALLAKLVAAAGIAVTGRPKGKDLSDGAPTVAKTRLVLLIEEGNGS